MQQLGIFPSFMYSDDASVNPLLNAHVVYPPGMYQTTTQPLGPYAGSRGMNGLGGFWSSVGDTLSAGWDGFTAGVSSLFPAKVPPGHRPMPAMPPHAAGVHGLRGLRGASSIGSAISGIGTLMVLGLASYGGYTLYKNRKAKS